MIPNFTFRDPTFFVVLGNGTTLRDFDDLGEISASFLSGRYGEAYGWQNNVAFSVGFGAGTHLLTRPFNGSIVEDIGASASFQNGTYFFALVDHGTMASESTALGASFGTGSHAETAFLRDAGTESTDFTATFLAGTYAEVIPLNGSISEDSSLAASIQEGSYALVDPLTDPLYEKAIVRFTIESGETTGVLDYTSVGAITPYTFTYLEASYTIIAASSGAITFDQPFIGNSFDNRYSLIVDAPVFPPPEPPPPGVIVIVDGTGTTITSIIVDNINGTGTFADAPGERDAFAYATFQTGTHALILVDGSMPRETAPMFASFLAGTYAFIRESGSATDSGSAEATFLSGSHTLTAVTLGSNDYSTAEATFLTGVHALYGDYVTADSTAVTADSTEFTADNVKPFSFDGSNGGYGPTFDNDQVFNFSQE